jgi:hypothetical protein
MRVYLPRMPKPFETWTVLPHRPIQKLEDDLWAVEGKLLIKDKPGLKTLLQQPAAIPDLKRVIVSHGEMLESGAAEGLRQAMQTF